MDPRFASGFHWTLVGFGEVGTRRTRLVSPGEAGEQADRYFLVEGYGAFLGRHCERPRLSVKGTVVTERPLLGLEQVLVLAGGVSLSADAVSGRAEAGVPISLISRIGKAYAQLIWSELTGTVQTRRHQLQVLVDDGGRTCRGALRGPSC